MNRAWGIGAILGAILGASVSFILDLRLNEIILVAFAFAIGSSVITGTLTRVLSRREGWLRLWLTAGMTSNLISVLGTIVVNLLEPKAMLNGAPGGDCFNLYFGVINFLCFYAIWKREKWGVYGLYVTFSVMTLLIWLGGDTLGILRGIISISLLWYLTRPVFEEEAETRLVTET